MGKLKCCACDEDLDTSEMGICEVCSKPYHKEKCGAEVEQENETDVPDIFPMCSKCVNTPGEFRA